MPYFTAGFPSRDLSRDALRAADDVADVIEVGVPFSDPLADGPTIQASSHQALAQGMTLPGTLELIASAQLKRPVVLFSYVNPVLRYGLDRLLRDAVAVGVSGLLLTDLPAGADDDVERAVRESPVALIRLVAPTSTATRLRKTAENAEGFLYLVARRGVTGASAELDAGLAAYIASVRAVTSLPLAVGFGISTPDQAAAVARLADGVVVGSALVTALDHGGVSASTAMLAAMRSAIDGR